MSASMIASSSMTTDTRDLSSRHSERQPEYEIADHYELTPQTLDHCAVVQNIPSGASCQDVYAALSAKRFQYPKIQKIVQFRQNTKMALVICSRPGVTRIMTSILNGISTLAIGSKKLKIRALNLDALPEPITMLPQAPNQGAPAEVKHDKLQKGFAQVASSENESDDASDITPPLPTRWSASDRPRSLSPQNPVQVTSTSSTESDDASSSDDSDSDEAAIIPPPELVASSRERGTRTEQQRQRKSTNSFGHAQRPNSRTAASNSNEAKRAIVDTTPNLPRAPHNRARRVLIPVSTDLPIVTVSMRADIQFFHRKARHRISKYALPSQDNAHVHDACVIGGDTVVLAYGRGPHQVSLVPILKVTLGLHQSALHNVDHRPHQRASETHTQRLLITSGFQPDSFITAGQDRSIREWHRRRDTVTSYRLTDLQNGPRALARRGRELIVALGHTIKVIDVDHLNAIPVEGLLNSLVHQIHVNQTHNSVFIFEVDHLDKQMVVYDTRQGFNRAPDVEFGYRRTGRKISSYARGDNVHSLFVKGYPDGKVLLWDFRNAKRPVVRSETHISVPVMHTVFDSVGLCIAAFGSAHLSFFDGDMKLLED